MHVKRTKSKEKKSDWKYALDMKTSNFYVVVAWFYFVLLLFFLSQLTRGHVNQSSDFNVEIESQSENSIQCNSNNLLIIDRGYKNIENTTTTHYVVIQNTWNSL